MKRFILVILASLMLLPCIVSCNPLARSLLEYEDEHMIYMYNVDLDVAAIEYLYFDTWEDTTIVLPDEYIGIEVTELGNAGSSPYQFFVAYRGEDNNYTPQCIADRKEYNMGGEINLIEAYFYITLTKGLKKMYDHYDSGRSVSFVRHIDENGVTTVDILRPIYYFTISEENENFYTVDGKLYNKKGELLNFIYEPYDVEYAE